MPYRLQCVHIFRHSVYNVKLKMLESSKYHLHILYTSYIDYEKMLMLIDQWQSKYHFPDHHGRWVLPSITAGICRIQPITGVESI